MAGEQRHLVHDHGKTVTPDLMRLCCFHTWRGLKGCQNSSLKSGFTGWWRVRNRAFWSWTNPLVGPEASLTGEPKQVRFPYRLLYVWGGTKMKDEKFPELVWKTHVVFSLQKFPLAKHIFFSIKFVTLFVFNLCDLLLSLGKNTSLNEVSHNCLVCF